MDVDGPEGDRLREEKWVTRKREGGEVREMAVLGDGKLGVVW